MQGARCPSDGALQNGLLEKAILPLSPILRLLDSVHLPPERLPDHLLGTMLLKGVPILEVLRYLRQSPDLEAVSSLPKAHC
jgi:hypothetical protein